MSLMTNDSRIIIALDFHEREPIFNLIRQIDPNQCRLKIGSVLFTRFGPGLVRELMQLGFDIFLDLKFHDIPNTVAGACRAAAELGVWMLTVHTFGGVVMLRAAEEAVHQFADKKPLIVGVTVLTSLDQYDLQTLNISTSVITLVSNLAQLAQQCKLAGIVCSPHEVALLRQQLPVDCLIIAPGIRLASDAAGDQKRIMTPEAAIAAGADYLVIGRSITEAADPARALAQINDAISISNK